MYTQPYKAQEKNWKVNQNTTPNYFYKLFSQIIFTGDFILSPSKLLPNFKCPAMNLLSSMIRKIKNTFLL